MKNTFVKNLFVFLLVLSLFLLASCKKEEAHVHEFGEWQTVKEATLNEEGTRERTCSCGET